MNGTFVLATRGAGTYSLRHFEGVPTVAPGLIVMHADSAGASAADAAHLAAELEAVLLASGPATTVTQTTDPAADPTQLSAFAEPMRQKLLVLVIDENGLAGESWFADWLGKPDRAVLTVFKNGASPGALLPSEDLRAVNAQFWKDAVTESVPAILSLSGLTLEDQRIFISYRRVEAQPLADQLFDALTHEGLDVFLDRFSIHAGLNFQQRLTQELADKSMVLLLESAWIEQSLWTEHEIQFTKRYQLGLLALTMPDRSEPLKSIDVDQRIVLKREDFKSPAPEAVDNPDYLAKGTLPPRYARWSALTEAKLNQVVLTVKAVHDQALFRRRRFIRANVEASLRKAGLSPSPAGSDGLMRVKAPGADYALWLTTRPPELVDFHATYGRMQPPPGTRGVVIGPTASLEPGRMDKLNWLKSLCKLECIDQDDVPTAVDLMKLGKL